MVKKPKLLFVYDIEDERFWKDGLWAAIELLKKGFEITKLNLHQSVNAYKKHSLYKGEFNFILGWGAFGSSVDNFLQDKREEDNIKMGLCIAGNAMPPKNINTYDVLFYETEWYKPQISSHKNIVHAFGVNTDIFKPIPNSLKLFDYLVCGAFAYWKRQELICTKIGTKMAIGEVQKQNLTESIDIIGNLILGDCGVKNSILPEELVKWYNATKIAYAPMDINGGGERFVWEAMACGVAIEIEEDNPKLQELINTEVKDHYWYAQKLKEGIMKSL